MAAHDMLDTDTCSYIIRKRPETVLEQMQRKAENARLPISTITYSELRFGAWRSRDTVKHNRLIDAFCERLNQVLPWDRKAADTFAKLQAELTEAGPPIGDADTMIAGHALSGSMTLVTNNQRHFERVPGLLLDNWVR